MSQTSNPLRQFFRQPAVYLKLPSDGQFWPEKSISMTENRELPVLPMTAIDEITYRTPDALFNGQAVISVIQSCIPAIKNAWDMPGMDTNAVLVAIRIASYGHGLPIVCTCPACKTEQQYEIDLRSVLESIQAPDYTFILTHGDLEIAFKPANYQNQNTANQLQFEEQRNIRSIPELDIPDSEKIKKLNASLSRITELTVDAMKFNIDSIRTPHALVTESEHIQEFLTNCDRKLFGQIRDRVIAFRVQSELAPIKLVCDNCANEYEQTVNLDQTSFFEAAS